MTAIAQATKRILVVDDDNTLRMLLSRCLTKAGYQVLTASHGGEAIAVLSRESVDLLLIDLMMPVMDGLGLLEWLRNNSPTSILALVFSSFEGKTMAQQALEAGATDYLTKPVRLDLLLERVRHMLGT
jgi:CheY-like chemotaxis protein